MKRQYAFSTAGLFSSEFYVLLFARCLEQQQDSLKLTCSWILLLSGKLQRLHETALSCLRGESRNFSTFSYDMDSFGEGAPNTMHHIGVRSNWDL